MKFRKSNVFIFFTVLNILVLSALFAHSVIGTRSGMSALKEEKSLVESLELTDICLFTEARYTRNPSLSDLHSPFQDSPMSMDHFPSGALMVPPPGLSGHDLD